LLGVYLELFSKIREASCKYVDYGLIMEKGRGQNEIVAGISGRGLNEKVSSHRSCKSLHGYRNN
jgi:hypothetical protein